jgi:hypothetical protein
MENISEVTLFVSIGALIFVLLTLYGIYLNTKKTRHYSHMQVLILSELAKEKGIEIDLNAMYQKANNS